VHAASSHTMRAAKTAACTEQTRTRIRDLAAGASSGGRFVAGILDRELERS